MKIIGITGMIGSGKSVVCRCVEAMGYPVYDCDTEARNIMDNSILIRRRLQEEFSDDIVEADKINRTKLAAVVFNDAAKLNRLNEIVHREVKFDFACWLKHRECKCCFIESAILFSSGFDTLVNQVWIVDAPVQLRKERVTTLRKMEGADFIKRNESQKKEIPSDNKLQVSTIINDGFTPLLPQIENLLAGIR